MGIVSFRIYRRRSFGQYRAFINVRDGSTRASSRELFGQMWPQEKRRFAIFKVSLYCLFVKEPESGIFICYLLI